MPPQARRHRDAASGVVGRRVLPGTDGRHPAWHYRSFGIAPPGSYRFGAAARTRGTFRSSAAVGFGSDAVSIRIT